MDSGNSVPHADAAPNGDQGSPGLGNRPPDPVRQTVGPQRSVESGGGDAAAGSIDQWQGCPGYRPHPGKLIGRRW